VRISQPIRLIAAITVLGASLVPGQKIAAQDSQFLMPEQSAAKAKQVLQQAIEALGGTAHLNVHDVTCTGRLSQFGHSGDLNGFETFMDYAEPPDKDRTENLPQRNIIQVYNGDKGWSMDRGGVSDAAQYDLARFQADVQIDTDNILRHRIHEPGMIFRYGGMDVVDLHQVEWVELVDSDDRTIRIAFSTADHMPVRKTVETRDPSTRTKTLQVEYFSNYHPINGIETPFQITRERNGLKIYQVFFEKCDYNTGISDSLFTKESLDERFDKIGSKKEKNKNKEKGDKGSQ
jgi:hypothetical protein